MENNGIIAELRNSLNQNFEIQTKVVEAQHKTTILFRRILRRLTIIYISLSACIVVWVFTITYIVTQRVTVNTNTLKNINELNKNVLMQRKFNEVDRQDIANARKELAPALHLIDSTKHAQDSIWKRQIKKQMK